MQQPNPSHLAYVQDPLSLLAKNNSEIPSSTKQAINAPGRQTRRRTSPEDQAILEAAFALNSRPDKDARAKISRKVSLGEREVSIWFQNKRQVLRRRSCPVESHEFTSLQSSSQSSVEGEISLDLRSDGSHQKLVSSQSSMTDDSCQVSLNTGHSALSTEEENSRLAMSQPEAHAVSVGDDQSLSQQFHAQESSDVTGVEDYKASATPTAVPIDLFSIKPKTAKLFRRQRSSPFTLYDESQAAPSEMIPVLPVPLKPTVSQPRLSTSLNGSVRIKTGVSPSPSPPRAERFQNFRQSRSSGPLQRSQSAIVTSNTPSLNPTASYGRSKDSRSWEFCCDAEVRDELTKQAERESSGSAAGAIGLIRSRSKGSLLAANTVPNKRCNTLLNKSDIQKRVKTDQINKNLKPKLGRAASSVARLQTSSHTNGTNKLQPCNKGTTKTTSMTGYGKTLKKKLDIDIYNDDGNESDKENWVPGTHVSAAPHRHRRHGKTTAPHSRILRENISLSTTSSSLGAGNGNRNGHNPRCASKHGKENQDLRVDDEVADFMSNGNVIVGEDEDEEELAGVQGLLSLSQGAWR